MADSDDIKLMSEESGDDNTAPEVQQVAAPEEHAPVEEAPEPVPKENGVAESAGAADSVDGQQAEAAEEQAVEGIEARPNLKRSSTDALAVPGSEVEEVAELSSPEKRAKVDDPDDSSKDEN